MRIGRTVPPAATPISVAQIGAGIGAMFGGERALVRFERELMEQFGVRHCFLVSSGKAALALSLLALKELSPDRDEVLIPSFTCYSVPSSIVRAGLHVRVCDVDLGTFDFDGDALGTVLAEASNEAKREAAPCAGVPVMAVDDSETSGGRGCRRLLAIVPTHLFGYAADVRRLRERVTDPEVAIVEDAAQAMGESNEGALAGTLGDIGVFSLGRGKAYSTIEGGIVLTNRDDLGCALRRRMDKLPRPSPAQIAGLMIKAVVLLIFVHPWLFWIPRGLPFLKLGETLFEPDFPIRRMSAFQAGLASNWRPTLEMLRRARTEKVRQWISLLSPCEASGQVGFSKRLKGLIRFPLFVRDVSKREALLRYSERNGLGVMPSYPTSVDRIPELSKVGGRGTTPVAERCARELVTLPTHSLVSLADMRKIAAKISESHA